MASVSPYQTKAGKRWRVQYRDPSGKVRSKRGFVRKGDAQSWADKNAVSVADGDWVSHADKQRTVSEYAELWLKRVDNLAPSSQKVYRPAWRLHVEPTWGTRTVTSIRPSQVQAWVDDATLGAVSVRRNVDVLAQILDLAHRDGIIKENPARGLKLPRRPLSKQVYLTAEQLARLAGEATYPEIVWLLGTVGLRWGELAGLRVKHVNVLRSRLTIEENAVTVKNEVIVGAPKDYEVREVAVPRFVMDMLAERCEGKLPEAWLWERPAGGPLKLPGAKSWFSGAVWRAQHPLVPVDQEKPEGEKVRVVDTDFPRVTPHGLRHVAAGLMISAGANVLAVSRQLGHADPSITLRVYAALFDEDLDAVSSAVENVVKLQSKGA
ncbi:tyrosine-type recombinase/integrase [Corynebacterium riegelii]|uniref:tyrosine-type recombinase/integrase n=1 Tax=Corynebacterium riegelii TaxID=156976 RepID=UPI00288C3675|nr:tyrosine-type recombinase/integrase [Corynebacterium riegelii]